MASEWLIDTEPFLFKYACDQCLSFKICMYLASVLITLSISNGTQSSTLEKMTIVHTDFRARNQFASQSRLIRIIYPFVMLLLELSSANHTEVPSRINVVFCNVIVYAYRINTRELPTFLARFAGARNTNIIRRHTKCKLCTHFIHYRITGHRLPLRTNLNSIQ